jgi:glycosyltransferase involved in cell wall biosynthesis
MSPQVESSTHTSPKVSVVIPAYNEELLIGKTLETLKQQDYAHPYEIVVCDNNSTDRTGEIAMSMGAKVVVEKNKGTRFAYDRGMRESSGDLILVTNADTRLPKNWISSIVKAYEDPNVVGVGTKVKFYGAPKYVNALLQSMQVLNPKQAMWGVSLSCRRSVYEKVGGFNHGVNTNEDAVFTLLIEKFGKVKILQDVVVEMDGRRFSGGPISSAKYWLKGYGLNSLYIQLNYLMRGEIKTLIRDFGDVRSSVFGQGEQVQIAVIVPASNDQATITQVLNSLQQQNFNYRFKVYVLDNFSIDLSLAIAKVFPEVQVVTYPKIYNFGQRMAQLLREINSPVVAFTTASAILPPDWLQTIYTEFNKERKQKLQIATGPYVSDQMKMISSITQQPLDKLSGKFEFCNCAMDLSTARRLISNKSRDLETLIEEVEKTVLAGEFEIHHSLDLKTFYHDTKPINTFITKSSDSILHTLKKIVKPLT